MASYDPLALNAAGRFQPGRRLEAIGQFHPVRFFGASEKSWSTEALALFEAMSVQPDGTRKTLIDTLIVSLKTAGIWDDLDTLYVLAAHDAGAALINWKSPGTYDCIAVNSPTFTEDRGYTGNGSNARLRTQYTPSSNGVQYTQDDASAWVYWLSGGSASFTPEIGGTVSPRVFIQANTSGSASGGCINAVTNSVFNGSGSVPGLFGMQRTTSTHQRMFKNGVQVGSDAAENSTGLPTQEQWICGSNASSFSTRQIAAAAWGASLTGKEADLHTILDTYLQAVGAV